jgi:hypothetical protein
MDPPHKSIFFCILPRSLFIHPHLFLETISRDAVTYPLINFQLTNSAIKVINKNALSLPHSLHLSQGTDITEAFESYHIRSFPTKVLEKFFVKEADELRNYRLTYKEDGFYRVLKSRVAEKLPTLDRSDLWKSKLCLDIIVLALFITSILAVRIGSTWLKIVFITIAGVFASLLNATSHNFIHQRNNWRMYMSNFAMNGWRDWRVYHGMVRN